MLKLPHSTWLGYRGTVKQERFKRRIYRTRNEAKQDVLDYIELFYNPKRRHGYNGNLSPVEFEKNYFRKLESV